MKRAKNQKIVLIPAKPLTKEEIFVSEIIWGCVPVVWINKIKYKITSLKMTLNNIFYYQITC